MKKWGFTTGLILLLLVVAIFKLIERQETFGERSNPAEDGIVRTIAPIKKGEHLEITEERLNRGDLLLVNRDYPVRPQGVKSDVVDLFGQPELTGGASLLDGGIRLSREVALKFAAMTAAAGEDGVDHFLISSGYRDEAEQSALYAEKGAEYALPAGYSEHNLGLSLDIGSTEGKMSEAAEGRWLERNSARYGFVLRYPADKTEITGIGFEPWHFRYVGLPHSAIMRTNNLVLEEYLDMLDEDPDISTTVGGRDYEIHYYAPDRLSKLSVPANRDYSLSGDNRGGVIVTVYL
ncbi:M15 family metallopeptidase [Saccharibacillus sp. CPCC 101409]|uniref:M15 family metallopeptidase n=1 Tax=Saccharibacillus sp. CPCC 101409 TaxID=3058041 RepID=UPI0026716727|nr:M15 family metallopeptidase [Saccharibacillus sp. CPCC 101409]MDO3409795.1 M15 family metallopeptidase [Saccharibacillus sp. CPCC 101409]